MRWPQRGVYFFRESSEDRSDTGSDPRIVRVGTHALKDGSGTKLWTRLSQHKGHPSTGGGNHRGSVFPGLSGFPNAETLNLTMSYVDVGLIETPRPDEKGPCIARLGEVWYPSKPAFGLESTRD